MAETNGFLHYDPVREIEGAPVLVFTLDRTPVVLRGSACIGYLSGWRAVFLYSAFAPILVLQLAHESGTRAVWYVSSSGDRLDDDVSRLSDHHRNILRNTASPILAELVRVLAEEPAPVLDDAARGFLALEEPCKRQILALCQDSWLRPIEAIRLADAPMQFLVGAAQGGAPVCLSRDHMLAGLRRHLQDQVTHDAGSASIGFVCPVTGVAIRCQGSLCFDDFHFAYRFTDAGERIVFYLIAGHELSRIYALYVHRAGVLFCDAGLEAPTEGARQFLPHWLPGHFIRHGAAFAAYLSRPLAGISSPLRAPPWTHIGHQLWNELSGIERYLQAADASAPLPEWIVPDGDREIEFYGPVDTLFPQLRGVVRRGLRDAEDLIRYAYGEGRCIVRITREHVSARMRRRLIAYAQDCRPELHQLRELDRRDGGPVVLLGLRLENRTLVDLAAFYERLIGSILARFPAARFVVDGHNVARKGHGKYRSHGEKSDEAVATENAERALFVRLSDCYGRDVVLNGIGLSVPESLLLIERCTMFAAPWGAGLAKYRWACNKPGYVFSSRWNLEHRADLHIYDLPDLLEAPSELRWIEPERVSDRPDAPRLVGIFPHPQWFNFVIDEAAATRDVLQMLADLT